jgi:hypothetical protein
MTAKAAYYWAKKARENIEKRIAEIQDDPAQRTEYLAAKNMLLVVRSAEVKIGNELNIK